MSGYVEPDWDLIADYSIARAVLYALVLVTAVGLFFASLFLCRQRADKARNAVRWMKAALFFTGIYAFFDILYSAFYVVYIKEYISPGFLNIFGPVASCVVNVARVLILATLSSYGRGLLFARAGQPAKLAKIVAIVTYVLVAVTCVLAVAYLGVALYISFGNIGYRGNYLPWQLHANRLYAVPNILIFVGSLASLAASGFIFTKVKTAHPTLKNPTIFYIAASFLFFVNCLYVIISIGLYTPLSPTPKTTNSGPHMQIVSFIFSTLPALLALVAVFHVTRVKEGGLATVKGVGSGVEYNPAPGFQGFQGQPMGQPMQGQQMQGQPMGQPMQGQQMQGQPMGQPMQGQPMGQPAQGQPMQSPPAGYQGGFFPQGAQPQGWQPQTYYYAPPQGQQQQGQQVAQSPPAQVPSPPAEVQSEQVNPHIKY